jgi:predicted amidohydrolase
LNDAVREQADILILPEVSIPVAWLPFMIAHARRHQIGIVFGLELWKKKKYVYNLIIEALPFKVSGKYKSCAVTARVKNHYAPAEIELIESLRLKPANKLNTSYNYHKIHWNGVCFATYNCFELSDMDHRTIFKSEIDFLIACVWNKDTAYYQHILESAVRDIHCYVVQSNTSQYGGSCVLRPTETVRKTMLYVKGGNNSCVLTSDIDIKTLRSFQYKSKPDGNNEFKILPPGYNNENVLKR